MSKTEEQVERLSAEAEQVWNNPLVRDFMDNFVKEMFVEWLNEEDEAKRNRLWGIAKGAEGFKARFLSYLAGGKALAKKKSGAIADGIGSII